MRISVNLATRPFVELRPLFAKLRLAMLALAVLAVGLGFYLPIMNAKAAVATRDMRALKSKTAALDQERATNEARMKQPDNQSVLERSQFLNAVFARKSFSWTAVMMELERVLPSGVQVTSIEPVVSKEGDVSIRLRVTGDRDKAIQLVRNLETSQRFVAPRLGGETALSAEKANALGRGPAPGMRNVSAGPDQAFGNGVEFEILSGYNPLPEKAEAAKKDETKVKAKPADFGPAVQHQRKPTAAPRPTTPLAAPPKPVAPKPVVPQPGGAR
jgi:type IV pilus assembly protein PilN